MSKSKKAAKPVSTFGKDTQPAAAQQIDQMTAPAKPVSHPDETPTQARARAQACMADVKKVLARFNCEIVPYFQEPEPVGNDGAKLMITASYGIIPER